MHIPDFLHPSENEKIFTKNPKYWDADLVRFDTATHRMVEFWDTAYQLYQAGEVDYVKLTEKMVKTISERTRTMSSTSIWYRQTKQQFLSDAELELAQRTRKMVRWIPTGILRLQRSVQKIHLLWFDLTGF